MTDQLRRQLIDLGIPVERQDAFGLSEAEVAQVLIAFAKRGLISATVPANTFRACHGHICYFYRSQEEVVAVTASFLEDGLRSGERGIWVLPAGLDVETARAAAHAVRQGRGDGESAGRLMFLTENDVYWDESGMVRSASGIIAFWLDQERQARSEGYAGIRITGDGTSLVSNDEWKSAVDYERLADAAFKGRRIVALCTYCLPALSPACLAEVLSGHDHGVVRRNRGWDHVHSGSGIETAIEFLQAVPTRPYPAQHA